MLDGGQRGRFASAAPRVPRRTAGAAASTKPPDALSCPQYGIDDVREAWLRPNRLAPKAERRPRQPPACGPPAGGPEARSPPASGCRPRKAQWAHWQSIRSGLAPLEPWTSRFGVWVPHGSARSRPGGSWGLGPPSSVMTIKTLRRTRSEPWRLEVSSGGYEAPPQSRGWRLGRGAGWLPPARPGSACSSPGRQVGAPSRPRPCDLNLGAAGRVLAGPMPFPGEREGARQAARDPRAIASAWLAQPAAPRLPPPAAARRCSWFRQSQGPQCRLVHASRPLCSPPPAGASPPPPSLSPPPQYASPPPPAAASPSPPPPPAASPSPSPSPPPPVVVPSPPPPVVSR